MANTAIKRMTFVGAMKDYFGFKPGQTLGQFADELKQLSDADRDYFRKGLEANGYEIEARA